MDSYRFVAPALGIYQVDHHHDDDHDYDDDDDDDHDHDHDDKQWADDDYDNYQNHQWVG